MKNFLIVIYKEKVTESKTFKSLVAQLDKNCCLIIKDNSPKDFEQDSLYQVRSCMPFSSDVKFYRDGENTSLSKIYNFFGDFLLKDQKDILVILDQDTVVSNFFVVELDLVLGRDVLAVPKVKTLKLETFISPRRQSLIGFMNRVTIYSYCNSDLGLKKADNLFAVGSGMVITEPVWNLGVRFNENLVFYGVDTEYCLDYRGIKENFFLLDSVFFHDISEESIESEDTRRKKIKSHMEYWKFQMVSRKNVPAIMADFLVKVYEIRVYFSRVKFLNNFFIALRK
ncbi:glycosyltransferase family protein [Marinobacterium lutimaris]|uniref:Glycosyltransferase, GT2 family n=1 Tax=Marinobacterium lutimaris TaxID=568106 RepID=A0A1H6B9N4_9GAMM|nr:hypothetical protein [Marinobacterium lutimaris]SEG57264.1 Glycosyltransferase, GT2 family [Marinobacterium lutimaris]